METYREVNELENIEAARKALETARWKTEGLSPVKIFFFQANLYTPHPTVK